MWGAVWRFEKKIGNGSILEVKIYSDNRGKFVLLFENIEKVLKLAGTKLINTLSF